MLAFVELH